MKKLLVLLMFVPLLLSAQTSYYIATPEKGGSDTNLGTLESPWGSWKKLEAIKSQLVGGDVVYIRGGVYYASPNDAYSVILDNFGGAEGNPITISNYQNEIPILDGSLVITAKPKYGADMRRGIRITDSHNLVIKGLTLRNIKQLDGNHNCYALCIENCDNILIDRVVCHDIWGTGFLNSNNRNLTLLNCDAYNCADWITASPINNPVPGNDGTGFSSSNDTDSPSTQTFIGCRAWRCGDQGFTSGSRSAVTWKNCWSFNNGLLDGGGNGFKMGWISQRQGFIDTVSTVIHRTYENCIAAFNRSNGWNSNDQTYYSGVFRVVNNTAYHNGFGKSHEAGFKIWRTISSNEQQLRREYYNNIAYGNNNEIIELRVTEYVPWTHTHNSWDLGLGLSDDDFVSLNPELLSAPRGPNGELPYLNGFLRLKSTSSAINNGKNVGLPYIGSSPDIGAYEYNPNEVVRAIPNFTNVTAANVGTSVNFNATSSISGSESISSYAWEFGDGQLGGGVNSNHTYNIPGLHLVRLTITDAAGNFVTKTNNINITSLGANVAPVASFVKHHHTTLYEKAGLYFDASSSTDADGSIVSYSWNMGNGDVLNGKTVGYIYYDSGTYNVVLTVTDNEGLTNSANTAITISSPPSAPVAKMVTTPNTASAGTTVIFDASTSVKGTGNITRYNWLFGDGTGVDGMVVPHTYINAGNYTVALRLYDDLGLMSSDLKRTYVVSEATVAPIPPVANFTISSTTVMTGDSISFDASSSTDSDGSIVSYSWDFGNGTGTGATVNRVYDTAGSYTATLTVTDNSSLQATKSRSITVTVADAIPTNNLLVEGVDLNVSDSNLGYAIPDSEPTKLIFRNNHISSSRTSGHMVHVGGDGWNDNAYNLDGAIIHGNRFTWLGGEDSNLHGVMLGYNRNTDFRYNFVNDTKYGVVHEGGEPGAIQSINTSGAFAHNIFRNSYQMFTSKGFNNVKIYNNTFYSTTGESLYLIEIKASDTGGFNALSTNYKIKNNIFYCTGNRPAIRLGNSKAPALPTDNTEGFECDYNVYYFPDRANNEPRFEFMNQGYSWAQWRAMGYDAHSVIIDPKFIDEQNLVPSVSLPYGTDLGNDFSYSLHHDFDWVVGAEPEKTKQVGTWQVGAVIPSGNTGGTYYVAVNGNDNNPGTLALPWATWQKAFNTATTPGDITYFRGGVYHTNLGVKNTVGISATAQNPVSFVNYPGETPILDGSTKTVPTAGLVMYKAKHVKLKGLTVRNQPQLTTNDNVHGIYFYNSTHVTLDQCTVHDIGYRGFYFVGVDTLFVNNCDSYNIVDRLSAAPGNAGDGFIMAVVDLSKTTDYAVFTGCRAWNVSDDGWDVHTNGYIELNNCWAFNCGSYEGMEWGNGFKLNLSVVEPRDKLSRKVINSLVAYNRGSGITTNDGSGVFPLPQEIYNNTSAFNGINNGAGHGYTVGRASGGDLSQQLKRVFKNNISYGNKGLDFNQFIGAEISTHAYNSWDLPITLTSNDFISVDSTGLSSARKPDGSLPDLNGFMRLNSTSSAIDKGTDVGLPFSGSAPDLGAYEYEGGGAQPSDLITNTSELISAIVTAQPGDVILLSSNTFSGVIDINTNGISANPIIIQPAAGFAPVFLGMVTITGDHITLIGLTLNGGLELTSFDTDVIDCTINGSMLLNMCKSPTIINNSFNGAGEKIWIKFPVGDMRGANWVIELNTITNIGARFNGKNYNMWTAQYPQFDRNTFNP